MSIDHRPRTHRFLIYTSHSRRTAMAVAAVPTVLAALTACGSGGGTLTLSGPAAPAGLASPSTTPAASDSAKAKSSTTIVARESTSSGRSSLGKPAAADTATGGASSGTGVSVLSGRREVTIVRVQAFESGVSLDNGRLTEADDDSGRQLFVATPLGAGKYLIKAYGKPDGSPAADKPSCWQVHNPQTTQSLTVRGADCDTGNPDQQFTITARGKKAYAISNGSAFLQHSPTSGLILEELGDAPLRSTFRFVDNGPARRPAGG